MERPMRVCLSILVLLTVLAGAGCDGALPGGVIYPSIAPRADAGSDLPVTHEFTFEGEPVRLSVTVDGGLYAGARDAIKSVVRFGNARENDWIEDYYPAFIDEPHQDAFFADVLGALRVVRAERDLDDDRYAELLTVFVQSLAYRTDPQDLEPKFPVETFVDGAGDCDDKSLLLAGLLAREGFDVALFLFGPEQHVALGIRTPDPGYGGTGYAYVETTAPGFIGMVPDELGGGVELRSAPEVFVVGQGARPYTASAQVRAILAARDAAILRAAETNEAILAADGALEGLKSRLSGLQDRMEALRSAGRMTEYNALVAEYNALVREHNGQAEARNALVATHNALAALDRAVVDGLDDRVGVYAAVASASP